MADSSRTKILRIPDKEKMSLHTSREAAIAHLQALAQQAKR
jgi:hypothetical protein